MYLSVKIYSKSKQTMPFNHYRMTHYYSILGCCLKILENVSSFLVYKILLRGWLVSRIERCSVLKNLTRNNRL